MWVRLFAFAMVVLIILMFIQFSTMSDSDVEKIRTKLEEHRKAKEQEKSATGTAHPPETISGAPQTRSEQ